MYREDEYMTFDRASSAAAVHVVPSFEPKSVHRDIVSGLNEYEWAATGVENCICTHSPGTIPVNVDPLYVPPNAFGIFTGPSVL